MITNWDFFCSFLWSQLFYLLCSVPFRMDLWPLLWGIVRVNVLRDFEKIYSLTLLFSGIIKLSCHFNVMEWLPIWLDGKTLSEILMWINLWWVRKWIGAIFFNGAVNATYHLNRTLLNAGNTTKLFFCCRQTEIYAFKTFESKGKLRGNSLNWKIKTRKKFLNRPSFSFLELFEFPSTLTPKSPHHSIGP